MTSEERADNAIRKWQGEHMSAHSVHSSIKAFIAAALRDYGEQRAAEERAACAVLAETLQSRPGVELLKVVTCGHEQTGLAIAAAIRARGEAPP